MRRSGREFEYEEGQAEIMRRCCVLDHAKEEGGVEYCIVVANSARPMFVSVHNGIGREDRGGVALKCYGEVVGEGEKG